MHVQTGPRFYVSSEGRGATLVINTLIHASTTRARDQTQVGCVESGVLTTTLPSASFSSVN